MLMCETRQANRETRQERGHERSDARSSVREERRPVRVRGEGPREGEEWMLVRRKVPSNSGKQWNNKGRR